MAQAAVGGVPLVAPGRSDKIVVFQPHSGSLSQRQKPLRDDCLRCGGSFRVVGNVVPSPSFSKPPLLSGPRFFLQLDEEAEEVIPSQGTGCGSGLDPC